MSGWSLICFLNGLYRGLRLFSDVWSVNAALFRWKIDGYITQIHQNFTMALTWIWAEFRDNTPAFSIITGPYGDGGTASYLTFKKVSDKVHSVSLQYGIKYFNDILKSSQGKALTHTGRDSETSIDFVQGPPGPRRERVNILCFNQWTHLSLKSSIHTNRTLGAGGIGGAAAHLDIFQHPLDFWIELVADQHRAGILGQEQSTVIVLVMSEDLSQFAISQIQERTVQALTVDCAPMSQNRDHLEWALIGMQFHMVIILGILRPTT